MWFQLTFRVNAVLLLILFARQSNGLSYRFIPEDDEFFEDCDNAPRNALNIHGFVDTSQISFTRNNGIITVSGNATTIWNIKPGDRIEPTQFSMTVRDCCAVIYDKPQYWYKYWTQHITNREEIKDQCFYPGVHQNDI
ncbi:uncharacterized protein Dmoj_GI17736 [Drosophila mojavensis]|uniref:Uncharacterized protein n=1 Tax=Drosophila mojavensis TaxID=7230 RepID=B4KJV6_DROMO|nr:uncharacterized protein Dmoj_GI17736 [Drosophila mojavensis]